MYKVIFDYIDIDGEWCRYTADNNGRGYSLEEAETFAYRLRDNGYSRIQIQIM